MRKEASVDSKIFSLKDIQSQIGNKAIGDPELIELNMIKEWAKAVAWPDPPNPLYSDEVFAGKSRYKGIIAPPCFFTRLGHGLSAKVVDLPKSDAEANGEGEYEPISNIRPGDTITTTCILDNIKEKIGRKGRLVFVYCRYEFVNQNDELVGTGMRSVIQIYN